MKQWEQGIHFHPLHLLYKTFDIKQEQDIPEITPIVSKGREWSVQHRLILYPYCILWNTLENTDDVGFFKDGKKIKYLEKSRLKKKGISLWQQN